MELFIQVQNGQPFEHPILGDNFREAYPHIDVGNLPPEFARFTRVAMPVIGVYQVYEGVTYERNATGFIDVHHVRNMSEKEVTSKQNAVKAQWAEVGFASWVFDEATCSFNAPVPLPQDEKPYRWDEATLSWVEIDLPVTPAA